MSGPRKHRIGPYETYAAQMPADGNLMQQYAMCPSERWGMRYSDRDPKRRGEMMYPVARDYAQAIQQVLAGQVQWGNAYFGPAGSTPALVLRWPLDEDAIDDLSALFSPIIVAALTEDTSGFGIPGAAVPVNLGLSAIAGQGVFTPNNWSLVLNTMQLAPMFSIANAADAGSSERIDQLKPLKVLADTLYHEARHCQQWFWMYALVQQYPDNFETLPKIIGWPEAVSGQTLGKDRGGQDQASRIVGLAAGQKIQTEPTTLISLKRMAIGEYLYTLNLWRQHGPYVPPYLSNAAGLEDEFQRARALAKDLLQHVGLGGTPIDVDAMVAEPNRCYCDYTSRPWENDAFFCGDMASAYWDANLGLALKTYPPDQCSRAYVLADRARQLESRLPGAGSADGRQ